MNIDKHKKFELIDDLFSSNIDPELTANEEEVVSDALMKFRRLKTQTKAELFKAKCKRVESFIAEIKNGLNNDLKKYKELANEVFTNPKYAELQPMFSNLTEISSDDEKSILLDAKYLELLDQLEDDFENLD